MKRRYPDLTKINNYETDDSFVNEQTLQTSALLRIAEATEKMAVSYEAIIKAKNAAESERDKYHRWYREEKAAREAVERSNSSLRGVITRMKNRRAAESRGTR